MKILVHLHLYYHEQLDWFLAKLKNITCPYDLYVTYVDKNKLSEQKLKSFKPDVKLIKVENRGYDVYPFWQVLQRINLDDYNYVLKLHTKNFRNVPWKKDEILYKGYDWRNDLIEPLIGSRFIFKKNLCILSKKILE